MSEDKPEWLKGRGYLHVTPKINVNVRGKEFIAKVQNPSFVANHAFFPLIHSVIKERKYKKHPTDSSPRAHSHFIKGEYKSSAKNRPLHYATHVDALIFGYYAKLLLDLYEKSIAQHQGLGECVIAYRKILIDGEETDTGKSTINFAHETFQEIALRAQNGCIVLMFDIKSFFSQLDHQLLKTAWSKLLDQSLLPKDHYNVFKAATQFRYILKDELRVKSVKKGRREGFDERKLADIRKKYGQECFFESVSDFRKAISNKQFKIYKEPFVNDKGIPIGIPQGLPISAVLANLYLFEFDLSVLYNIVNKLGAFYRRYSDDILIVCKENQANQIEEYIKKEISQSRVLISDEKTEKYIFEKIANGNKASIVSQLILKDGSRIQKPLTYLGFEFYGDKTLIKSANLAKFYRRMIYTVKRKANLAAKIAERTGMPPVIYKGRLKRLYSKLKLTSNKEYNTLKRLAKKTNGFYDYQFIAIAKKHHSNYFSYVNRSSKLMEEKNISKQLRKHKAIFNTALARKLKKIRGRV